MITTQISETIRHEWEPILLAPETVDFNVNGACNLDCKFCWGPVHNAEETLTLLDWKELGLKLAGSGTSGIVLTGGETLIKEDIEKLAQYLHEDLGLRTTLSTNGILLRQKAPDILPYIDDIGIPLDGHTVETNNVMRVGTPVHFSRAIGALALVQKDYPNIDLTLRTVVSRINTESVPLIGRTLLDSGIDPTRLRWKLYQCDPVGPRAEVILRDLYIEMDRYQEVVERTIAMNPEFNSIVGQSIYDSIGRYLHINPDGSTKVVVDGGASLPYEINVGNIALDFNGVLSIINQDNNSVQGHNR
jgi:MoaA/NifB/PqqE/SkfB family radical SAM enzyme